MDILVDISSRLSSTEHFVDEVRTDKAAEAVHRGQSLLCTQQTTETSRGCIHRQQVPDEPQQADTAATVDILDAVRAKVANG